MPSSSPSTSSSSPPNPASSPHLPLLPTELLLKIFSHIDPGNAACLGLTCKRLYAIHRSLHGSVPLETRCRQEAAAAVAAAQNLGPRLYELLEEWYGPGFEMCWCGHERVRAVREKCGVEAGKKGEGKCAKCRITVFSKPQLRVKLKWVYHFTT